MPYSLVFDLTPQTTIPTGYLAGKHLHALFLTLVSSVSPELGSQIHGQTHNKSFTISPLQIQGMGRGHELLAEHRRAIAPGTPCWFRVSLLDDQLFSQLTPLWLNLNPNKPWHLGPADLYINRILGTPNPRQPWANFVSYASLYEQASNEERQISLTFCTPTAFRQQKFDTSLPSAEAVFGSLLRRWNDYGAASALSEAHGPFSPEILACLFPSAFDIRTEIICEVRSKFIGCVGTVTYRILGEVEPETIKQLNTLADFALYAGVGRKTPMGMGMVRRSPHSVAVSQSTPPQSKPHQPKPPQSKPPQSKHHDLRTDRHRPAPPQPLVSGTHGTAAAAQAT